MIFREEFDNTIVISFMGDICLGDHLLTLGSGLGSFLQDSKNRKQFVSEVSSLYDPSDMVVANLECVLSEKGLLEDDITTQVLRGRRDSVDVLKELRVSVVNLANNHSCQYGLNAFTETKTVLEQNSIIPIGLKAHDKDHQDANKTKLQMVTIKGKTIGLVGYSMLPEQFYPGYEQYARIEQDARREVLKDVETFKEKVDVLVVSMHWGTELDHVPDNKDVRFAHKLVDSGADIIVGHHPHVIQGVEEYKGKLIIYSLGDFIFDLMWDRRCREGMIVTVKIMNDFSLQYDLTFVYLSGDYKLRICTQNEHNRLNKTIKVYSKVIGKKRRFMATKRYFRNLGFQLKKLFFMLRKFKEYNKKVQSFLIKEKIIKKMIPW